VQSKIELLDVDLLQDSQTLKDIDRWLNVMNWPNGWHYDLDIIWLLRHIEEMKLPKGATIVDAGAGLGMTQFILASYGYNVISLDFTDRQIPKYSKKIFAINKNDQDLGGYTHEYMEFMKYGQNQPATVKKRRSFFSLLTKAIDPRQFNLNVYRLSTMIKKKINLWYIIETMKDHGSFGKITFTRGTFNSIPLKDNTADALVSVSAFEHNTYEDMPGTVKEFQRVVKNGSPILVTTSASENEDWYFKPPKAWNFSKQTLAKWFAIPDSGITFNYRKVFENIINSKIMRKRLSPFYTCSGENGLPYGNLKEIKYIPVGIVKVKE